MNISIIKRNGKKEPLNLDKIHRVVEFACVDINNVSVSEIELKAELQFFDGIKSSEIQETLIKSAADLISEDYPNYQFVASRLINYDLRKRVYGQTNPLPLKDIVKKNVKLGVYDSRLLEWYTDEEFDQMDSFIKHERDFKIAYAGMVQLKQKYLLRNKVTNEYYETPQIVYMLIGASAFASEKTNRLRYIRDFYNSVSNFDFSLPTPIMAGVRTSKRQFASCVLLDVGDSLDSIGASGVAIMKYAANRAGLGVNVGRIRAVNSPIRNGEVLSTGMIPFMKKLTADLKSCSQGGIRNASATFSYPMWHYEYEDLIVLKNSKGTEDTRIRGIDYNVQINKILLNRFLNGENITLFSPSDVPGLYDAFFRSNEEFEELYVKYENDPSIRKKTISALDAFTSLILERKETGRIYFQFVDNTNDLGIYDASKALIYMTNLCVEITEATKPLTGTSQDDGEISLCNLAAYNLGTINSPEEFEKRAKILVRFLDNLLDYQEYPIEAAYRSTNKYRHLGIGVINLAYFLAKHNQTYSDETSPEFLHPFVEAMAFYTIKASIELAKERGHCVGYDNTKWSKGILPIDKYRTFMDTIVSNNLLQDWEKLRKELLEYGIRNATLMAIMPAETSAIIANATNGVEPPRALVSIKNSKDGALKQVVPEIQRLKNKYELLWDQKSPKGYLRLMGVFNKFLCQSISTNTSYNPDFFENREIPMSVLVEDMIYMYQLGLRTAYYNNEFDGNQEIDIEKEMENIDKPSTLDYITDSFNGISRETFEEDCESCVI